MGYDSIVWKPVELLLLFGILMQSDLRITTNCIKYSVLNILHTFNCVGDINYLLMPFSGTLKSILMGSFLYYTLYLVSMCSYSSSIGNPSTISYSFTICFLILVLYCPLFAELITFCSSVSLLICTPLISCLNILKLTD